MLDGAVIGVGVGASSENPSEAVVVNSVREMEVGDHIAMIANQ